MNPGGYSSRNGGTDDVSYLRSVDNNAVNDLGLVQVIECNGVGTRYLPTNRPTRVSASRSAHSCADLDPKQRMITSATSGTHKRLQLTQIFAKRIICYLRKCLTWRTPPATS